MWLNLHGCQAVQRKLIKRGKRTKKYIFTPFWAYIGQPDNHIGWATSMLSKSIDPILTQGPIYEIFMKKYWELT